MPKISEELNERALAEVAVWAARTHGLLPDRGFCGEALAAAVAAAAKVLQDGAEPITDRALSPQMAAFASEMSAQKMAVAEAIAKSSLGGSGCRNGPSRSC